MGKITSLQKSKNGKKITVFIDGAYSFSIDKEVALNAELKDGYTLSLEQIEELQLKDIHYRCLQASLSFINFRPRSEREVRQRLKRHKFASDISEQVIIYLKNQGLVNDITFAQYWKDNRLSFSPRSKILIMQELRQKGIANELANEITEDIDNEDSAYRAGLKKARLLSNHNYDEFRHKLHNYLRYRGFHWEIIDRISDRLWQEINNP